MEKPRKIIPHPAALLWFATAMLIAVFAYSQAESPKNRGLYPDVATHVMIASSVWNDLDLVYTLEDLARFRRDFPIESGPRGLFYKATASGEIVFAKPYLYGGAAAPFYGMLGIDGFIVLNSICFLLIGFVSTVSLSPALGQRWALIASLGFILPSPFTAWISVPHPDLFIATLLAASVYLLLHASASKWHVVVGAVLFAASIHEKPTFIILLPFVLLAIPSVCGIRTKLVIIFVGVITWLVLSSPNFVTDGTIFAYQGSRFGVSKAPFPLEPGWTLPKNIGQFNHVFNPILIVSSLLSNLAIIPSKLFDFMFGRQTGIAVYFPVAIALIGIRLRVGRSASAWLLVGFFVHLSLYWVVFPTNGYGGGGSYGPRYMMQALPLVPLSFIGCQALPYLHQIIPPKIALAFMFIVAVLLQWRVLFVGNDMVHEYHHWFLKLPLSIFPVENWLLPTICESYSSSIMDRSPASGDMLFHKAPLEREAFFGLLRDTNKTTSVLFHSGLPNSVSDLELLSRSDVDAQIRQGEAILWEGRLHAGQPARLRLEGLSFDSKAFDLLYKQMMRYAMVDLVAVAVDQDPRAPVPTPSFRFARNYMPFAYYGSFIRTANLAESGVVFGQGWSHLEAWGVWSDGNFADLLIHVGSESRTYEVTFRLHGYNPPESPFRNLQLIVNGRQLGALELSEGAGFHDYHFMFRIRPDEEFIHFGFEIRNPVSPAELGHSSDHRRLGVGLSGFKLTQVAETLE